MNNKQIFRPEILQLTPYSSARREASFGDVWLNANENPWAPQPENLQLNRYPEPQPPQLVEQLANLYEISPEQMLIGRGSDEAIDLLVRACCRSGIDSIIDTPPTYGMYTISATIQGAQTISIPLLTDFNLNINAILAAVNETTKILFICSPNNPTANLFAQDVLLDLCVRLQKTTLVVVDEAYLEFSDASSMAKYIPNQDNLVVLRTLSKAYGLAAARCGVALANQSIIDILKRIIAPYPIPTSVVATVLANLTAERRALVQQQINIIQQERRRLIDELKKSPAIIHVWPSQTNFILFKVADAGQFMAHFAKHGLVLRDRSKLTHLDNCVRITVGQPDENNALLTALQIM